MVMVMMVMAVVMVIALVVVTKVATIITILIVSNLSRFPQYTSVRECEQIVFVSKASRGFEPRSLDSESRVLTTTPRGQPI